MTGLNSTNSLRAFQQELTTAEAAIADSAQVWAVREADLERRLAGLNQRFAAPTTQPPTRLPVTTRDAVRLYSSRWCHIARNSVVLAK